MRHAVHALPSPRPYGERARVRGGETLHAGGVPLAVVVSPLGTDTPGRARLSPSHAVQLPLTPTLSPRAGRGRSEAAP